MSSDYLHMNCMLVSSHPEPVRRAIQRRGQKIDENPDGYIRARIKSLFEHAARKAGEYLELAPGQNPLKYIRQTESTTVGLAHLYNGIRVRPREEFLTSEHDFFSTRFALDYLNQRTWNAIRRIRLFEEAATATEDEILRNLEREIKPYTRVLALTWVLSSHGLKLPVAEIGELVAKINRRRSEGDRLLFCLDGVHAFGVENFRFDDLRCDFFVAGCHKWLFGPRGTAIVCGRPESWDYVTETVPSLNPNQFPGGILPYEYHWAVAEAFEFQLRLGKADVQKHTVDLARKLKKHLAKIDRVTVVTPMDRAMSSGIVCCDIDGVPAREAVGILETKFEILASRSSPDAEGRRHVRFSPSILNSKGDVKTTLDAVRAIAKSAAK